MKQEKKNPETKRKQTQQLQQIFHSFIVPTYYMSAKNISYLLFCRACDI